MGGVCDANLKSSNAHCSWRRAKGGDILQAEGASLHWFEDMTPKDLITQAYPNIKNSPEDADIGKITTVLTAGHIAAACVKS